MKTEMRRSLRRGLDDFHRICAVLGVLMMLSMTMVVGEVDSAPGGMNYYIHYVVDGEVVYTDDAASQNTMYTVTITYSAQKDGYHFIGWTKTEGSTTVDFVVGDVPSAFTEYSDSGRLYLYPVFAEPGTGSGTSTDPYRDGAEIWTQYGDDIYVEIGATITIADYNGFCGGLESIFEQIDGITFKAISLGEDYYHFELSDAVYGRIFVVAHYMIYIDLDDGNGEKLVYENYSTINGEEYYFDSEPYREGYTFGGYISTRGDYYSYFVLLTPDVSEIHLTAMWEESSHPVLSFCSDPIRDGTITYTN